MNKQTTNTLLMVEPTRFGFNEEAFETNSFQNRPDITEHKEIQESALTEFNAFVEQLKNYGVNVLLFRDRVDSTTPDSIFPNNWFSTHASGDLITYPMAVSNRRKERRTDIMEKLIKRNGYFCTDFSHHEWSSVYLEGTGSMIFDHARSCVYAALSPRTHETILNEVAEKLNYEPIVFKAYGKTGELIYHTNVMMCIGRSFIAIGLDTIDKEDLPHVNEALRNSRKDIIPLSNDQVYNHFAGNMLQVENQKGESILVLSETAHASLSEDQLSRFRMHNKYILPVSIPTIERIGGGSARCMLAEVFLPE